MPPSSLLLFFLIPIAKLAQSERSLITQGLKTCLFSEASKRAACWYSNPEIWSLSEASEVVLLLLCLMGVDSHSRDFKEQRGGYRCVTTHRVLICSEKGGIQSGSFSSSRTEHRAFSKRPAVIQCISEIKASPHSCLMLTDSWRNWSFHSFLLYLLFRSLPWSLCNSFQT